ncbi:MAG: copper homeostasis protein CutC [bacterium]|nr:copper homeostasis protein CutC [bacterium]
MQNLQLEVACFSLKAAVKAAKAGAHRIEFCSNKSLDGISGSEAEIQELLREVKIPIYAMVRCRGGNFVYTEDEFLWMQNYIKVIKKYAIAGFVFGCLNQNHSVNKSQNKALVSLAAPLPCTFHKAFDVTENALKTLEDCIECGFKTILSSGQKPTALAGKENLAQLIIHAKNRIQIMPGGSVRSTHVTELLRDTGTTFLHASCITNDSEMPDTKEIEAILKSMQS